MLFDLFKIISLAGVLIALNFFFPQVGNENHINPPIEAPKEKEQVEPPLILEAKSACVFDISKNKYSFEKEASAQLPLASLAKLMTALVAKEHFLPTTLVEISREALLQEGDSGLRIGEMWSLPDITKVMLISSSNDAAFAIASSLKNNSESSDDFFVKLMNRASRKLDLKQTYFLNSTGLDISESLAGAYGSCKDMVRLTQYILNNYPDLLEVTTQELYTTHDRKFENTNKMLNKLSVFFGGKTGFSDLAGGNLIIVVDKGLYSPIIIAVLGSTPDGRFKDVEMLYNKYINGFEYP